MADRLLSRTRRRHERRQGDSRRRRRRCRWRAAITPLQLSTPQPGLGRAGSRGVVGGERRVDSRRCSRRSPTRASSSVGISGQMHSSVFLDAHGEVIRPALLWCDGRTTAECREITERVGGEERLRDLACEPGARGIHAPEGAVAAQSRAGSVRATCPRCCWRRISFAIGSRARWRPSRPTRRRR